ncbi:MAG: hypothetical protein GVY12_02825 [Bacteroidetes bacterium]|jgi:choline/glycine/proline betaine transport protein|nr:hypothetical protein [Bacteroidota bacterium]
MSSTDWKQKLKSLITGRAEPRNRQEVVDFLDETVAPALASVKDVTETYKRQVRLDHRPEMVSLTVFDDGTKVFHYAVRARSYRRPDFAFPHLAIDQDAEDAEDRRYHRAEVYLDSGAQGYDVFGFSRDGIIRDFLRQFDKHIRWRTPAKPRDKRHPAEDRA